MLTHKNPKISVVIPAYNEAAYLPTALASLASQTFKSIEVIVADNNSTDKTAAIARAYGARVVHETKPGVCAARQTGFAVALGEIVVSTDADTRFDKAWLTRIAEQFEDPGVVGVTGAPEFYDGPLWGKLYPKLLFGGIHAVYRLTGNVVYASACNLAFRRSAFAGYNTELTQGGDELYVLRELRPQGRIVYLANNPIYTSGRRLKKGFLYNILVTMLAYYFGDYVLSKLTRKSVLGSFPAVRDAKSQRQTWGWKLASFAIVGLIMGYGLTAHAGMAEAIGKHVHRPHLHYNLRHDLKDVEHPQDVF